MRSRRDAVVVGGGHNGLVAAAYLARDGMDVLVCERRDVVGGAAVSERPFGPEYLVTSLSYVVSLLPADLVADLQLTRHGYHVYPQGPYLAPRADGSYLRLPDDTAERHREIGKFSAADAAAYPAYEVHLQKIAEVLGPMLAEIPPRLGSRRRPTWPGRGCCCDTCASWTRVAPSTSPACSPGASLTCSTGISSQMRSAACCRCPASSAPGPAEVAGHRLRDPASPHRRH